MCILILYYSQGSVVGTTMPFETEDETYVIEGNLDNVTMMYYGNEMKALGVEEVTGMSL